MDRIFIDEDLNQNETNNFVPPLPATALSQGLPELFPEPMTMFSGQSYKNSQNLVEQSATAALTPNLSRSNAFNLNETPRTRKNSQQSKVGLEPHKQNNTFLWNCTITIEDSRFPNQSGKKITIDRKSWITKIDEQTSNIYPFIYSLDGIGYPKNPMGRTGVRGRGALMRYGPNKEIMAIVTRWKKTKNRPIYVERRKLLEFIAVKDPLTGSSIVPGDKILGNFLSKKKIL